LEADSLGFPDKDLATLPLQQGCEGAVRFTNQATFHIVKYLQGLARAVHGEGCAVFEGTKASRVSDGNPCSFKVPGGRVTARRVILATNVPSPIKDHAVYGMYEYPTRSYIVAGKTDKRGSGMYINTGSPTRSILFTKIEGENWLLVGGESHFAGMSGPSKGRYEALRAYAKRHLGLEAVQFQWSTWDYTAYDGLPLVGKLYPFSQNIYTATGYRKWGMTNSCVAAMILTDELSGRDNSWARTFRTSRMSAITSLPRGIIEGIGFHK
jgi:glycine/D-amino acid oxidase-like deaminating enzyme